MFADKKKVKIALRWDDAIGHALNADPAKLPPRETKKRATKKASGTKPKAKKKPR